MTPPISPPSTPQGAREAPVPHASASASSPTTPVRNPSSRAGTPQPTRNPAVPSEEPLPRDPPVWSPQETGAARSGRDRPAAPLGGGWRLAGDWALSSSASCPSGCATEPDTETGYSYRGEGTAAEKCPEGQFAYLKWIADEVVISREVLRNSYITAFFLKSTNVSRAYVPASRVLSFIGGNSG